MFTLNYTILIIAKTTVHAVHGNIANNNCQPIRKRFTFMSYLITIILLKFVGLA